MTLRTTRIVLLAALFALATAVSGFAQAPCGVANQITCQPWDGGSNLYASQNDTNGFGNFATTYQQFTLTSSWDVESFHWVGGYFNPPTPGTITAWTVNFYNDNGGIPGNQIYFVTNGGTDNETFLGSPNGFPIYQYDLTFSGVNLAAGSYWASVVPDLGFPPQWGWATGTGTDPGYQCFQGTCGSTGVGFAYAIDGTNPTPEPGTLIMFGSGLLGLAGVARRKFNR